MPSGDQAEQQGKPIEWIDFGMMGILSSQQRRILIDLVTNVVMQDAYKLKLTVLKVAKPKGEIDHAYLISMCEDMCSQYSGTGFGDFALGDLLGTILDGLQVGNFKVEPFLTNLARGIIAMEGTIKTLSKKVNILDAFTDKLHGVMDFNINLEHPEEMNPDIALKLFQLSEAITNSSNKTAEAYDMLEKGQIKVGSEFSFEDKTLNIVNRLTGYLVRALVIVALIIGSSILCTSSVISEDREVISIIFRAVGFVGFVSGALLAFKLCKDVKKGK